MLRTIFRDPERYQQQYFSQIEGIYFTGDGARRDEDGYFWIMGRVDDVINVSGHRLGTMEIESALVSHPTVAEAAVVGRPDEMKGQAVVAFVTLEGGRHGDAKLRDELRQHVVKEIGALARPDDLRFTDALPKTRSGKIMRRLLRQIAAGDQKLGDTTTLEDLSVLAKPARGRRIGLASVNFRLHREFFRFRVASGYADSNAQSKECSLARLLGLFAFSPFSPLSKYGEKRIAGKSSRASNDLTIEELGLDIFRRQPNETWKMARYESYPPTTPCPASAPKSRAFA